MNPLISIVVPVYQVEKYIENSIKSICNQSYKNIEVILVNDGSKDRSIELAEKILIKSNINYSIINQENKGLASARNEGIKKSNGEWVICVDSDDIIYVDFIRTLYEGCKINNSNVSIGSFQYVNESNLFMEPDKLYPINIIQQQEILFRFLVRDIKIIAPAILINKKIIMNNNLWYKECIRFSEDQHFIWMLLLNVDKVSYTQTPIYNYYVREKSIMTSSSIDNILTGYYAFIDFTCKYKGNYNHIVKNILPRWVFGTLRSATKTMNWKEFRELALKLEYKKYFNRLLYFPEARTKILSIIALINLKSFYFLNKKF